MELYGRGIDLRLDDPDRVVEQTTGVTASFIKELLRKASLRAALTAAPDEEPSDSITVTDVHINAALDELMSEETSLTRRLLGGGRSGEPRPGTEWLEAFDEEGSSIHGWASYEE